MTQGSSKVQDGHSMLFDMAIINLILRGYPKADSVHQALGFSSATPGAFGRPFRRPEMRRLVQLWARSR